MTDTTITVATPEADETTPADITLAIATGVALAEAEAAGEEADEATELAETAIEQSEAATETAQTAIAATRTNEEEIAWLRDRVASLEDRFQSPPILTEAETTEALLILPNSEDLTDPATLEPEAETQTEATPEPPSDASPMDAPVSDVLAEAVGLAPPRRKRRVLI